MLLKTYVIVGTTLACREDGIVDALLEIQRLVRVPLEEDQTSTGTTESLVSMKRWGSILPEGHQ